MGEYRSLRLPTLIIDKPVSPAPRAPDGSIFDGLIDMLDGDVCWALVPNRPRESIGDFAKRHGLLDDLALTVTRWTPDHHSPTQGT